MLYPRSLLPRTALTACALVFASLPAWGQTLPASPDQIWTPSKRDQPTPADLAAPEPHAPHVAPLDPKHQYTLPELVDRAERQNPATRVAWEQARARVAQLHVAQADYYPTLVAVAMANTQRIGVLFNSEFARQTLGLYQPFLQVSYTIFDFGRQDRVARARDQLTQASFAFNSVHLNVLFETARRYYRLLDVIGQRDAAEVNLKNAQTVRDAVNARLAVGLATLPDALEARASAAQAEYDLQAILGQVEIARGDLLTVLGDHPNQPLEVQPLDQLTVPDHVDTQAAAVIDRGLQQRPELAGRVAERRAADAQLQAARAAYLPSVDFSGIGGEVRAYGQQNQLPSTYAGPLETWNVSLNLRWTLFDGGRREARLAEAHDDQRRATAQIHDTEDQIEQQVWDAYVDLQTALHRRAAAAALLTAARTSYEAALKAFQLGVRTTVDVVTAQRLLAQAMSQNVDASTGVLIQLATLGYRTGDLLTTRTPRLNP